MPGCAFPKCQVPDKLTAFRLVAHFRETGSGSDRKRSGRPTELHDISVENIRNSLLQSPRIS
jgi:hypothetical protein